jgi:hypothetical protein
MAGTMTFPETVIDSVRNNPDSRIPGTPDFVGPPAPVNVGPDFGRIAIQMLPFTAVSFSELPLLAWGRLLGYSALSAMLWSKHKQLAYVAGSAAGLSLVTSLTASAMAKK